MAFRITMHNKDGEEVCFPCEARQTLSEAAETAGYRVISCASGYCGACTASIISGRASLPFATGGKKSAEAGEDVLLCRCVPESDLVVNARFGWMKIRQTASTSEV